MPDIVPVELALPSGTWFTLYQPGWDDADDDSLAFLGDDDRVFVFPTAAELASYVGSSGDAVHHLASSALWREVRRRPARAFIPSPDDCYDLTVTGNRSKEVLSELLVYLRLEPPTDDWSKEPFAGLLPHRTELVGVPLGAADPRASTGPTLWHWAVAQVEAHLAPGPSPAAATPSGVGLVPVEKVAPSVEVLWLALDQTGAYTLVVRGEDSGWAFLGTPGQLRAAQTVDGLAALVAEGGAELDEPPWQGLRGRTDLDLEPYEDNVIDLDELGTTMRPTMDAEAAAALLDVWALIQELATWLDLADVTVAFTEDQPLGRFFVRDLLDLVSGSRSASDRMQQVDFDELVDEWTTCTASVAARIRWVD